MWCLDLDSSLRGLLLLRCFCLSKLKGSLRGFKFDLHYRLYRVNLLLHHLRCLLSFSHSCQLCSTIADICFLNFDCLSDMWVRINFFFARALSDLILSSCLVGSSFSILDLCLFDFSFSHCNKSYKRTNRNYIQTKCHIYKLLRHDEFKGLQLWAEPNNF